MQPMELALLPNMESVRHALGLTDLDLGLVGMTVAHKERESRTSLTNRKTDALGDILSQTRSRVKERKDGGTTLDNLTLLLAVRGLALLVALVEGLKQRLRLVAHGVGDVGIDNGDEELTGGNGIGGHNVSFLRLCAIASVATLIYLVEISFSLTFCIYYTTRFSICQEFF